MPDIPGTSRAQTLFLRAFHKNPNGPTPDQWPAPAILRRWLRKPNFRRALFSLLQTLRFQADFTLAAAATSASQSLANPGESARHSARLTALLRLSHSQRFGLAKNRRADTDDDDELASLEYIQDLEDAPDPARAKELAQHAIRILPPDDRLTEAEFHKLATDVYDYVPNISDFTVFPPPPAEGSDYHRILANPGNLICFLKRFNDTDPHKRYAYILKRCKNMLWPDADIPPMANSPSLASPPTPRL